MSWFGGEPTEASQKRRATFEFEFKQKYTVEQRKAEASRIVTKYPGSIPVVAEVNVNTDLPPLRKNKFLVKTDMTVGQFIYTLRKHIGEAPDEEKDLPGYQLPPSKAIFLFMDNHHLPPANALMSQVFREHQCAEDGFLYVTVSGESTFGTAF